MESSARNETPVSSSRILQPRNVKSAPVTSKKAGFSMCRQIGLKRKSTTGTIFQSPLKRSAGSNELNPALCSVSNNLFSRPPISTSQEEIDSGTSLTNFEKDSNISDIPTEEPDPDIKQNQTQAHLSSIRSFTPVLSRRKKFLLSSVTKKLNLSPGSKDMPSARENLADISKDAEIVTANTPSIVNDQVKCLNVKKSEHSTELSKYNSNSDQNSQCSDAQFSAELQKALTRNYPHFLTYDSSSSKDQVDQEIDPEKQNAILQLKQMFHDITTLKQSLLNAKQHDLSKLQLLTAKWREGCQQALLLLLEKFQEQGNECDMPQLLVKLGIPSKLVKYDENIQDFVT